MAERTLTVRLRAVDQSYQQTMTRAGAATTALADKAESVTLIGSKMEDAGKKATLGFTLPVVAGGVAVAKAAISYESAFAGVRKTVDGTEAQMASLRQGIVDMANQMPASREEIAGVAEAAGQLGIETGAILGFTRTMIDLGESTNLTADQAATSLARLANITQMPQSEFDRLGSSVVAVGNNMATTEAEVVDLALRLAAAGEQVGLTEAQTIGLAGALSSLGVPAEAGGTALSRVMMDLQTAVKGGGAELDQFASIAGVSSADFARAWEQDAAGALVTFIDGLGRVSASGGDVATVLDSVGQGDIRVRDSLLRTAGAGGLLADALDISTAAWDENLALTREAEQRYGTSESRLRIAANRTTDLARQTGEALVPALLAVVGVLDPFADGLSSVVDAAANAPGPVQAAGSAILGIALVSGPAAWALGKLAGLYAPVVSGFQKIMGAAQGLQLQLAFARASGLSTGAALATMVGPQAVVVAGLAAMAGVLYLAKQRSDEMAASHVSSADAALTLAESAGIATQELRSLSDQSVDGPTVSDEQFRRKNEDTLKTLREIDDLAGQQAMLSEIAYGLRLRGVDPADVIEQVERLADIAGIEIPTTLTVDGIDDFEVQIAAAVSRAKRAAQAEADPLIELGGVTIVPEIEFDWDDGLLGAGRDLSASMEAELDNIARNAAQAFEVGNFEGFIQILAAAESQLGDNAEAVKYLAVEAFRLTEVDDLNRQKTSDLESGLRDFAGTSSQATEQQKRLAQQILGSAGAMNGGRAEALGLAAAQRDSAFSMGEYTEEARNAGDAAGQLGDDSADAAGGLDEGASAADDFAAAIERAGARAAMSTLDFDAGAAAASSFAKAIDATTAMDNRLGAGLSAGSALRGLSEGILGTEALAEARRDDAEAAAKQAKETEQSASAIDRLADAARRADPKMSGLQLRLDTLAAAGDAFRESLDRSSMLDDQIGSALSLGDAYEEFEDTYRRLPEVLDLGAISWGKLRPRERDAIQNLLDLGKAARDYLATMIEMGSTDAEVAGQAAAMRAEYERMFREMGMGEAQIRSYIEAMGLAPEQISTAIELSGVEAARFQLDAYLQLLEGRIPDHIAVAVIGDLEAGNIEGAAAQLAAWARTNPAEIPVQLDERSLEETRSRVEEVRATLWDLPRDFDPLTAALGGYNDAQTQALEGVLAFGDAIQSYLSQIAGSGTAEEVRAQAEEIQQGFLDHLGSFGIVGEAAQEYLDLVGLSDWQIDSAINLSGDAEAMFRLQAYAQFLGEKIPTEVALEVMAMVDEGNLQGAADRLAQARDEMEANARVQAHLDATPALGTFWWFRQHVAQTPAVGPLSANPEPAAGIFGWWRSHVASSASVNPIDADLTPAQRRLAEFQRQVREQVGVFSFWPALPPPRRGGNEAPPGLGGGIGTPWGGGFSGGGLITGPGSSTSDSIPIRASNGEYMLRAAAVGSIGLDALDAMNRTGVIPGTAIPVDASFGPAGGSAFDDSGLIREVRELRSAFEGSGDVIQIGPIEGPSAEETARRVVNRVGVAKWKR